MKRVFSIVFALTLVLGFSLVATTPVAALTLNVPSIPYPTIQAAVNGANPGDTILVAAGTYNEAVTVDKSNLTIQGAGPAATFITTTGATPGFTITVNGVTIRDLTITNSTGLITGIYVSIKSGITQGLTVENVDFININAGGSNAHGIYIRNDASPTPMSFSGLTVRNCRFRGTNTASPSRNIGMLVYPYLNLSNIYVDNCKFSNLMTGVYMGRSSVDGFTFTNNEFGPVEQANYTGAPGGIYIGDSADWFPTTYENITVNGNTFHDYNRGVNIWNYANGRTIGRVDITNNAFTNSIASSGVMITARWKAGYASTLEGPITISGNTFTQNQTIRAGYAMVDIRAGIESATSQIDITGNTMTFDNPTYADSIYGIKLRGPVTNVDITHNTMNGNLVGGASADMPPTSGIVCGSDDTTYGSMTSNATINIFCNSIQEFVHGVSIYDYVAKTYGNLPTGASIDINRNSVVGNSIYGVISGPGEVTDAEDNWWDDDSGPGGVGPGTGDPVSSNVDYTPWIKKSVPTATSTGNATFSPSQGDIVGLTATTPPVTPPVELPHGMFSFTICCIPSGGTVTLTVTLPAAVPVGTVWWKYQNGGWYSLPNLSNDGDNVMVISLTDGGSGDEDSVPGQITDDGGPGLGGAGGAVGWETHPINKVRVLLPWIALIAATVAGMSLVFLRQRRAQS